MTFGSRHVLQGIVKAVDDQIQGIIAYEDDVNPLRQLMQTGYIVQQIVRLDRLLDATLAAYGIPEPRGRGQWHSVLLQERQDRVRRFQALVENKMFLIDALGDEQQQLEMLTLLVYDFQRHAEDTYTELERGLILNAYETCTRLTGLTVVTVPEWFVPAYEVRQNRWQGSRVIVEHLTKTTEEVCIRQASAWWDLHHPHVMKLFGACHVGKSLLLVREIAQCMNKTASTLPSRDVLLGTSHVLQFLHERHITPANLTLEHFFSTEKERKVMFHGGDLLAMPAWDIDKQAPAKSPVLASCPSFLERNEWEPIEQLCVDDLGICGGVSYVMNQLEKCSKQVVTHRHFWNRKPHQLPHELSGVVKYTQSYVDPKSKCSATSLFQEINDIFDEDESEGTKMDAYILERLLNVHQKLLGFTHSRELIHSFIEIIVRFKRSLARRGYSSLSSFCVASSRSLKLSSLSFHGEIDALLSRFGLTISTPSQDWKPHCDYVRQTQQESFQSALDDLVDGLEDDEERVEAATLLVFEATNHRSSYDQNQLRAIQCTATTIVECHGEQEHIAIPKWFIPRYEIAVGSQISAGSFGAVHHGKWLNATVAVKCLFRSDRKLFLHEANIWFALNHPHVVKLFGACHVGKVFTARSLDEPTNHADRRPFFVCEYASEGTLNEYIKRQQGEIKSRLNIWGCLCEAARGLQYLHERGIVHGDLKGNNILVGSDRRVKLTDFGLSVFVKNLKWTESARTIGAVRWKAPERLRKFDRGPSFASDIYSFGMCIIEAVTGTFPWRDTMDEELVVSEVTQGRLPPRPASFNNEQWDLVTRMCCLDPADRVTISEVVTLLSSLK
ncbi:Leucine-rich repeat serine/threonine-protein kinase 2 [Phytophthora boehmeriae]|uniref:Leucine-rich repeat serine/threonine-protein kinase 2 n=1 Tax=Phytophthora boehmeriae TaxID=109152 RepID=A0A8T1WTP4_9STRA|nr:Leucine-rich repeat serine/threonine-protein kinase 2 [Phytophthora boehmeriae]